MATGNRSHPERWRKEGLMGLVWTVLAVIGLIVVLQMIF